MSGFLQAGRPPLILASTSKIRARMLEAAGLAFIVEPPGLDETVMRQAVSGERSLAPHDVAEVLARAKAADGAAADLAGGSAMLAAARPGRSLDTDVGAQLASAVGAGSDGRIHPDEPGVSALGARAVSLGSHIAFAPGEYDTGSESVRPCWPTSWPMSPSSSRARTMLPGSRTRRSSTTPTARPSAR